MICEFCKKEYNIPSGLRLWSVEGKKQGYLCSRFCCWKCGKDYRIEKRNKNFQLKWGVENPLQLKSVKEKIKKTNLEKYGVENILASHEVKEKVKKNNLERYGSECNLGTNRFIEESRKIFLKKYGVDNPSKISFIKEKKKETSLKNYGVDNFSKTDKSKQRYFDYEYVKRIQEKVYQTKKKNNTFTKSKDEDKIFNILKEKYFDVIRQYKSSEFPWSADFYIPSKGLYIDYQGIWTHGKEPFDENKLEHQKILEEWTNKANEFNHKNKKKNFYRNAIYTWTILDVRKRNHIKDKKLNRVEFYSIEEFLNWFNLVGD